MSEENPASKPTPVQDVQGDGRWISLVSDPARAIRRGRGLGPGLRSSAGSGGSYYLIGKLRAVRMVLPKEAGPGGPGNESATILLYSSLKHHRFVADSKDKEPEVVFIGDSLVQLMHQCEVRPVFRLQARMDMGYLK